MHAPEMLLAIILMASLTLYVLLGGADSGGGVWDLLSSGPRRKEQRELISNAITPVWEANHVWADSGDRTPLCGIPCGVRRDDDGIEHPADRFNHRHRHAWLVFAFRAYHTGDYRTQRRWGLIFAITSTATPICLGVVVGSNLFGARVGKRRCLG